MQRPVLAGCQQQRGIRLHAAQSAPLTTAVQLKTHLDQGYKVVLYAVVGQLLADLAQRLYCLVPDHRLLHLGELLQRLQQRVGEVWPTHIGNKLAQLLCHGQQHLILIIIVFHQEGQQLRAGTLLPKSQGNG
jgi:hypothetical protein